MSLNYPGPYEVRIFYTVTTGFAIMSHSQRLNVRVDGTPAPGTPMADIDFLRRDNTPFAATSEIDAWVALMRARFATHASNVIQYAELWKYEPESFDASFVSTYDINLAANGGGTTLIGGQEIYTFRTEEGGIMKLNFMQSTQAEGAPIVYSGLSVNQKAIVDAVRNGTSPWLGRDTSYPFSFIKMYPGRNEALFKKIFRP